MSVRRGIAFPLVKTAASYRERRPPASGASHSRDITRPTFLAVLLTLTSSIAYDEHMASKRNLTVTLPADLSNVVRSRVAAGEYDFPDEIVHAGLRILKQRKLARRVALLSELRGKIAVGLRQARRGELIDADEVFDDLERKSRRRQARRA